MPKYLDMHGLETLTGDIENTYLKKNQRGVAGGVASLDSNGKVPTSQIPEGAGGPTDYDDLTDKPQINGVTLSGNKTSANLGLANAENPNFTGSINMGRAENTTVGEKSTATGTSVTASGSNAHAEGGGTTASGNQAHAEGGGTTASGTNAHSEGAGSEATNSSAHAEGTGTTASGDSSHSEGNGTTASGYGAHAEGSGTIASGLNAHAEGGATSATMADAHAEGEGTQANANSAHAEGSTTRANGSSSHSEGGGTIANGGCAHAEGSGTTANGASSHAEGGGTVANGAYSHVGGRSNVPDDYSSWAEWTANANYAVGDKVKRTVTENNETTVTGYICKTPNNDSTFDSSKWDVDLYMNYAEIIGNGSPSTPSNARTLDWDGNEALAGDLTLKKGTADEFSVSKLKTEINSKQDAPSATGTAGQVLALDSNLKPVWTDQGGGGSTADCVKKNGTDEVTAKNLQIVQKTYSPNLYNTETITDGIYLNPANGSENANSGYMTTDYIPVEAGEKYYGTWQWKLDPTRRDMMLNFVTCYNESKEVMGSVGMTSPSNPITIPTGVAYIRISQSNQDYYEYRQFEKGTAGTHYYPYGEILDEVIKDQYMPEVSMRQIPAFELVDGLNLFNSNDPDYEPGKFLTTNGSVSDNSSYATSGYIKVEPGDYIVFAYYIPQFDINNVASMRTIACYDADKNNLSTKGIYSSNTFDVPSGVSYVRICWHSGTYGTNVQIQKVAPYESFYPQYKTYEEPHYELKRDYMYGMPGKPEHVFLPSEIYVAVGRTIELYNEQIVLDHEKYHFVWICGEGYAYKRKFSITGSTVGNKNLTLELYDDKKNLCWRGVCTIHVVSASNPSVKILPIGDSLTNWKAWLQETMLLSSQNVEFVGTRFSGESVDSEGNVYARGTIHSEGRSGFSAGNYLADTSYTFDDRYDGVGTVSGTANPFWDGSKFSLNHYLTTQTGVPTPDAVQLFLGTNDLTNGVETAINNIVALVTSIRSEYSTLPIFVCNTIFRSNQNGYGSAGNDAYVGGGGAGAWQYEQDTRVMDLMVGLRKRLADVTGITFIPLASCMDREYGFGQVMTKVNPRCAVEVPMPEESVHPVASGYYQMADLMYSTYCGVLS